MKNKLRIVKTEKGIATSTEYSASGSNLTGSKGTRVSLDPNSQLWWQQR